MNKNHAQNTGRIGCNTSNASEFGLFGTEVPRDQHIVQNAHPETMGVLVQLHPWSRREMTLYASAVFQTNEKDIGGGITAMRIIPPTKMSDCEQLYPWHGTGGK